MENGIDVLGKAGPSSLGSGLASQNALFEPGRPSRLNGPPKATTTISTIAIKAGDKTRLTLAVLKVSQALISF